MKHKTLNVGEYYVDGDSRFITATYGVMVNGSIILKHCYDTKNGKVLDSDIDPMDLNIIRKFIENYESEEPCQN